MPPETRVLQHVRVNAVQVPVEDLDEVVAEAVAVEEAVVVAVEVDVAVDKWWEAEDAWDKDRPPSYRPADAPSVPPDVQMPPPDASAARRHATTQNTRG